MHSALWLVLSFFSAAGIWLLLQAEFLAIALVLVYVGAVMVLFLFVVMMLDVNFDKLRAGFRSYFPSARPSACVLVEMARAPARVSPDRRQATSAAARAQQHPGARLSSTPTTSIRSRSRR